MNEGWMSRKHPTKGYEQLKCKLSTRSATSKANPQKSPLSQKIKSLKDKIF